MKFLSLPLLFLLATTTATAARLLDNPIQLVTDNPLVSDRLRALPYSQTCNTWRSALEMNNLREATPPDGCVEYVGMYIKDPQYIADVQFVFDAAYDYAKGLKLKGDGKDAWVFDVDDTVLSNVPYFYDGTSYVSNPYVPTAFLGWQLSAAAPAVSGSLDFYNRLVELGFKIVFISERSDILSISTKSNLEKEGFNNWEKVILREISEDKLTNEQLKAKKRGELVAQGYRIWGNVGDQWSDTLGDNAGSRTFKISNCMYYLR